MKKTLLSELKRNFINMITAAFGLVAALQWNEAIKQWIAIYVKTGEGAVAATWSAVIVTIIAVFFIYFLSKFTGEK
jgi:hypothetical protein